jgi:hypothetical protein
VLITRVSIKKVFSGQADKMTELNRRGQAVGIETLVNSELKAIFLYCPHAKGHSGEWVARDVLECFADAMHMDASETLMGLCL